MSNTILVLEHKAENRLSLQEHLSRQGFEVTLADNSHEGLSLAFEVSPKLILLDLMLPSLTGYQSSYPQPTPKALARWQLSHLYQGQTEQVTQQETAT